ncbi:MAG: universal stress protein [Chloroflexota bacterium]|nr:universal stress protein [Chloroflexota bacterium]
MAITKFLVPVCGGKVDDETVRLACTIAEATKGKVYIIYVIEVARTLPLDAELELESKGAELLLSRAEKTAEAIGCEVETEILQAREKGPAIVDEAVERGVDMVIMGLRYEKKFGDFDMGDTVPYVMRNAPCRVLVWREPISEGES